MFCNKCIEKSFIEDIPFNFEIKFSLINPLSYLDVYTYGVLKFRLLNALETISPRSR